MYLDIVQHSSFEVQNIRKLLICVDLFHDFNFACSILIRGACEHSMEQNFHNNITMVHYN